MDRGRHALVRKASFLAVAVWTYTGVMPVIAGDHPLLGYVDPRVVHLPTLEANDLRFTRLSTAQGLSQTRVSQIVEDDQGFMWFGTQYGVNRYDGYNFKIFVNDPKNPNSLSDAFISALFKDRHGKLWIGCSGFLNRLDPVTESFKRYPIPLVTHISEDGAGWLWLSTGQGLFSLDAASGRIEHYIHDPQKGLSLSSNHVTSSLEDKEGGFWVLTTEGLDKFDRKTRTVTLHVPFEATGREAAFYEDRQRNLWISQVTGNGLAVFDRKSRTLIQYSLGPRQQTDAALTGVSAIVEDQTGALWFATMSTGLFKLDQKKRTLLHYSNNPSDPDSLARNGILTLCKDRKGGIWAALVNSGVSHFEPWPPPFEKLPLSGNREPFVTAIYEDRKGLLWVATRDALNRFDRKTGEHELYHFRKPGLEVTDVISIIEDHSGVFWAGTFSTGLLRLDPATHQFKTYRHDPRDAHSLSDDTVTRMLVDRQGFLWIATWDGLNRFDASTERFTRYYFDPGRKDILYLDLIQAPDGAFWLGTHSTGVQRFGTEPNFTGYQHRPGDSESLSDSRVNSVHFDRSGVMWVGTQNGLNRFEPETSKFTMYTKQEGLAGNVVSCILEDDRGDLWMSTNDGISQFNIANKSFRNYSVEDGLPGRDLTGWGACFKSKSGEMFFGGFSGGTAFYPERVSHPSYTPSIVLTDFRLFGGSVAIGPHSVLTKSISYTNALTLSHRQNVFSLEFSSPNHSATTRYRYRLDNIDRQWNETTSEHRSVTYGDLSAGDYIFRAQASNIQGEWSAAAVVLNIRILPAWWNSLWFRISCCSLAVFLGWLAYLYRMRQIAEHFQIRMEGQVAERTRIARDLHDTLLQSFHGLMFRFQAARNMLPRSPEGAMRTLDEAISSTRDAITEGRDAIQDLRSEPLANGDLAQLLEAEAEKLAEILGNQNSPAFRVIVEGEPQEISPSLHDEVYRIAHEVMRNAFRHAGANKVEAEIRYDKNQLRLRVRDDGRGLDPKILDVTRRPGHWGLAGIRERAQQIGAQLRIWSEDGAGTEIELTIPAIAYKSVSNNSRFRLFGKHRTS